MLFINDLTYRIGGRVLLDKVSLSIPAGHRVGLVGPNGAGKSTLFKLVAGEIAPDGGEITLLKGATLGMVRQEIEDDSMALIDIVLAADSERASLLAEAETCEDPERIGEIYERLTDIGAYDAPSRAATILSGLGFDDAAQQRPISDFSGGWRMRVALAAVLFQRPNVLMLDEPTNHLDFEAMVWLESFLARYNQTLIIISHDRDILNKTVTHIVHLEHQKVTLYTGTYDEFERRRAERLMNQQALHEKQMAQKAHMQAFVDRFGATASKARQAQSRLKMIQKMDIVDAVMADRVTAFTFPEPEEQKAPMIVLDGVDAGYAKDAPILRKLNLRIDPDDRIALLGANGNGKSTLMKLIAGRLPPLTGEIHQSSKLRIGYFAQFQTDELDTSRTPYEIMRDVMKTSAEPKVRALLSTFGFDKYRADTRVGEISGGEKARLLFCLMSYDAPHIMLLDEPTNHLDMDAREALMQALNNYKGAVILVSHDPHLVGAVVDRLWLVADGSCKPFDEDLDAYRELVIRQRRRERENAKQGAKAGKKSQGKSGGKSAESPEQKAERLEKQITELTARRDTLENDIANACASGDSTLIQRLERTHAELITEIASVQKTWEECVGEL